MVQRSKEYFGRDLAEVARVLVSVRISLRVAQEMMTPEAFISHLHGIELDEGAAADWLASDGSIESITDRMMPYLLAPVDKALSA